MIATHDDGQLFFPLSSPLCGALSHRKDPVGGQGLVSSFFFYELPSPGGRILTKAVWSGLLIPFAPLGPEHVDGSYHSMSDTPGWTTGLPQSLNPSNPYCTCSSTKTCSTRDLKADAYIAQVDAVPCDPVMPPLPVKQDDF